MTILKPILKAFGYTIAILVEAFIFAIITWAATQDQDLGTYVFWGGIFLGILAVLTDELKKREALVTQHAQERTTVTTLSHMPVLSEYALGIHQVSTTTVVDLNLGMFGLYMGIRTDLERSKCVLTQHAPTHTPINQITQD